MLKIIGMLLLTMLMSIPVYANQCPNFTPEQAHILGIAKAYGDQYDPELYDVIGDTIGYTTASVTWQESIVGEHIVRFNAGDGKYGSWGVMHTQISTIMYVEGIPDTWETRDSYIPWMITNLLERDSFAISKGYNYLKRMILQSGHLWSGVALYRGTGILAEEYRVDVRNKVNTLIRCYPDGEF